MAGNLWNVWSNQRLLSWWRWNNISNIRRSLNNTFRFTWLLRINWSLMWCQLVSMPFPVTSVSHAYCIRHWKYIYRYYRHIYRHCLGSHHSWCISFTPGKSWPKPIQNLPLQTACDWIIHFFTVFEDSGCILPQMLHQVLEHLSEFSTDDPWRV